jgi:putative ABC transport system permease protein
LIGVAAGIAGVVASMSALESLLFGVKPADTPTLLAVTALLLAVAAAAHYLPARRATGLSPVEALRCD